MPKAIRFNQLGGPEVLHFEDIPKRQPGPGEVLLKVEATGLNRAESLYYHGMYLEKVTPALRPRIRGGWKGHRCWSRGRFHAYRQALRHHSGLFDV